MHDYEDAPSDKEEPTEAERWAVFAQIIAGKRDEAVTGRTESGIEDCWRAAEEAYFGIDDTNRHEFKGGASGNMWTKPTTMAGSLTRDTTKPEGAKSTGFVRLTSRYVDAGAAKVAEITIPVDGKAFSFKATPIPEAMGLKDNEEPFVPPGAAAPVMRPAGPEDMPPADPMAAAAPPQGPPTQMPGGAAVPLTKGDLAKHAIEEAEEAARKAETRIHDWLVECTHPATMRKVEKDMARLGVGVLKGPTPDQRSAMAVTKGPFGVQIVAKTKQAPTTRLVDPWNFFPDPACGENIHDGDYCLEREFIGRAKLERLKGRKPYIAWAIDKVLAEGPEPTKIEAGNPQQQAVTARKKPFVIWYFYGQITLKELALANQGEADRLTQALRDEEDERAKQAQEDGEEPGEPMDDEAIGEQSVFAIVALINSTPIRVTINPLEKSGGFPYHAAPWLPRAGSWAGVGVAEQVNFPQRLINAAVRAGMNNAAKSAGSIIGIDDLMLEPADGSWVMTPDKFFRRNAEHAGPFDIRQAMAVFQIPNVTPQIMQWIEIAIRFAEESTNIPLITQGQSGKSTPDTFGGQQLQDSNAMQLLRDVGYGVAENITNPMVTQMYEWLLLDPDVPDDEKGDMQVDVNAGFAMIEKALQDQAILMLHPLVQDPGFGFDKRKYAKTWIRIKRLNPSDLMMSDDEFEKAQQQPPPPPPQVMAAQVRAQSAEKIAAGNQQLQAQRNSQDLDRDVLYEQSLVQREQIASDRAENDLQMRWQLGLLEYAKQQKVSMQQAMVELDKIKAGLATKTMEMRLQRELAGADGKGPQVAEPPTEPEGRAKEGTAYQA
jgi:hypothetical protein